MVFPALLGWRVLNAVDADKSFVQAANTGLTEGSTPNGNDYDRDIVIITLRLDKLHLLDKGEQVWLRTTLFAGN
ncbi:MAG: hypothetical protein ACLR17_01740 [Enterobacteriaceae bacterium]